MGQKTARRKLQVTENERDTRLTRETDLETDLHQTTGNREN